MNKRGIAAMALGVLLILSAVALVIFNRLEEQRASMSINRLLPEIVSVIDDNMASADPYGDYEDYLDPGSVEMKTATVDGREYIGLIAFPNLKLELPVLANWDYDTLRISPCRYSGSILDGSLIVAGHNYTKHFGMLGSITEGDTLSFTDVDGKAYEFAVARIELLEETEVEEMRTGGGSWDMTVFTCNYSGRQRLALRCVRI